MGHVAKRGGKWQGAYRDPARKERTRTFSTRAEAQRWVTDSESDMNRGQWSDPTAGRETFREYAKRWRGVQTHRRSTATQVEAYLRRHVYPRIGDRQLVTIRRSDLQALVKGLSLNLAPASVRVTMSWVGTILKAAVADGVIARNPATGVPIPTVLRERVDPLPVSTVIAIAETIDARYRAVVLLGAGTGVRISEALGVTVDRIDFLKRRVRIDRQLDRDHGMEPVFGPVKDWLGRPRTIPLAVTTVDALAAHISTFGTGPAGLVFTGTRGGPVGKTEFATAWRAAADPLGVEVGKGYHQLRHTYASLLIAAGESVKTVQDRLGHASAVMTLDVYGHLWPEDEDRTRDAVETAFGAVG
ncbi:MAG: tyrosine-type recombinase/integrase [Acidimicrobiales bacterium]